MAGRGLGGSISATHKLPLALWAPGSPKAHSQGNLSTGFRQNGDRPGKDAPTLSPARNVTSPLVRWTQLSFTSHSWSAWLGEQPDSLFRLLSGSLDIQVELHHTFL